MSGETVRFIAPLQMWHNERIGSLGFVIIEGEAADAIRGHELMRRLEFGHRRGFGSVKVTATCGGTTWQTSVFPPSDGGWFLPVKKLVQRAEGLAEGDPVEIELELL